jgi:hypothetical protein
MLSSTPAQENTVTRLCAHPMPSVWQEPSQVKPPPAWPHPQQRSLDRAIARALARASARAQRAQRKAAVVAVVANPSHPATPVSALARRAPMRAAWLLLTNAWRAWRQRALHHASLRALEGLDDRTLHDLGLAERLPYRAPSMPMHDFERGRW